MKRGLAIALVYFTLILIPIGLGALLIPPVVERGRRPRRERPRLRPGRRGLRPGERDAQRPQRRLRHHHEAPGGGGEAAEQGRRRRRGARRHRGRRRQLGSSPGSPSSSSASSWSAAGPRWIQELHPDAAARARRANRADPEPDRQRRRQLRRWSPAPGDDRRGQLLHRAQPSSESPSPARSRSGLLLRPDPGGRRDDRGLPGRDRAALRQLPRRADHLGRSSRSSTSRSRTT